MHSSNILRCLKFTFRRENMKYDSFPVEFRTLFIHIGKRTAYIGSTAFHRFPSSSVTLIHCIILSTKSTTPILHHTVIATAHHWASAEHTVTPYLHLKVKYLVSRYTQTAGPQAPQNRDIQQGYSPRVRQEHSLVFSGTPVGEMLSHHYSLLRVLLSDQKDATVSGGGRNDRKLRGICLCNPEATPAATLNVTFAHSEESASHWLKYAAPSFIYRCTPPPPCKQSGPICMLHKHYFTELLIISRGVCMLL